jgi:lysophospholipase L1-like esterase
MDINYYQRPRTPEERKRFISLVAKARDIVNKRYGVPFVVLFWETMGDGKAFETEIDWVIKNLRANEIDVLQLSKVRPDSGGPQYYITGDAHPNRKGHALAANELTRWLSQLPKRPQVVHDD